MLLCDVLQKFLVIRYYDCDNDYHCGRTELDTQELNVSMFEREICHRQFVQMYIRTHICINLCTNDLLSKM